MKKFLLILLCPCFLIGQNYSQEFDVLFESKNYTKAVQKLEVYLTKTPQNLELLELMGDAYGFQRNWDKAASYYKQLRDLDPENATYHYKYGGVLGRLAKEGSKLKALGLISKVKTAFLKAAELDPVDKKVRWALVELYAQLPGVLGGSNEKAMVYASDLEALSKPHGFFSRAYVYENSNRVALAKTYYKKGLEVLNKLACFQTELSRTSHLKSHNNSLHFLVAKACMLHDTQLSIGQNYIQFYIDAFSSKDRETLEEAYMLQAQLFRLQNKISEALASIEKALSIKSDFKPALKEKQIILLLKP
ncbi:MAG: tetratricopeptide repeat protein [Flavobacteriaceae bacterium]|jgi:tetratricopeptide (TPR) repeat protein|nr:tetratricopeptide repeat protein [Formosa sp.]MDG1373981.1 tetratricopeptide repeat protein [Flavobacteriaceae bacterium]MDG2499331.1 tetratricopeptide repeat protein [Flavobacteriaceae bacterium]